MENNDIKIDSPLEDAYAYLGEIELNICNFKKQLQVLKRAKAATMLDIQAILDNTIGDVK